MTTLSSQSQSSSTTSLSFSTTSSFTSPLPSSSSSSSFESDLTDEFYLLIRHNVLAILHFLIFTFIAYNILRKYTLYHRKRVKRRPQIPSSIRTSPSSKPPSYSIPSTGKPSTDVLDNEDREDDEEDTLLDSPLSLTYLFCVFSFSVSLQTLFLISATIFHQEFLHHYITNNYYLSFLDPQLFQTLWTYIYHSTNISLFGLLPFAYFYHESSFHKSFLKRVRETGIMLGLVYVLGYLFLWGLQHLLNWKDGVGFWTLLNQVIEVPGAIACWKMTPMGIWSLFRRIKGLAVSPGHRVTLKGKLEQIEMEIMTVKEKLGDFKVGGIESRVSSTKEVHSPLAANADAVSSQSQSYSATSIFRYRGDKRPESHSGSSAKSPNQLQLEQKLQSLRSQKSRAQRALSVSPFRRNVMFLSLLLIHLLIYLVFLLRIGLHVVTLILHFIAVALTNLNIPLLNILPLLSSSASSITSSFSTTTSPEQFTRLSNAMPPLPLSTLLSVYFTLTTLTGLYHYLKPTLHSTSIRKIENLIWAMMVLLVISSSLKIVVPLMGLVKGIDVQQMVETIWSGKGSSSSWVGNVGHGMGGKFRGGVDSGQSIPTGTTTAATTLSYLMSAVTTTMVLPTGLPTVNVGSETLTISSNDTEWLVLRMLPYFPNLFKMVYLFLRPFSSLSLSSSMSSSPSRSFSASLPESFGVQDDSTASITTTRGSEPTHTRIDNPIVSLETLSQFLSQPSQATEGSNGLGENWCGTKVETEDGRQERGDLGTRFQLYQHTLPIPYWIVQIVYPVVMVVSVVLEVMDGGIR